MLNKTQLTPLTNRLIFQHLSSGPSENRSEQPDLSTLEGLIKAKQELINEFIPQLESNDVRNILKTYHETKKGQFTIIDTRKGKITFDYRDTEKLKVTFNNEEIDLPKFVKLFENQAN